MSTLPTLKFMDSESLHPAQAGFIGSSSSLIRNVSAMNGAHVAAANSVSLSIVIPVYNERRTIREIIARVKATPREKEIIIVDDFSTDGTRAILRQYENDPEIKVIYQERNFGKGAALRRGFSEARKEVVIVQDADLEYDPQDYEILVQPIEAGRADVVYGSRFQHGVRRVLYYWHSIGNRTLTALSNMFSDLNLTDMETCYKAFKRPIIQNIILESDRFGFEPEITAKVARLKCVIYEVPINYYGRSYAQGKKITWRDGLAALWFIIKYSLSWKPFVKNRLEINQALVEPPPAEDVGLDTLEAFEDARRYNGWIMDRFRPFIGQRVLEIGSGIGNIAIETLALPQVTHFTATDISRESLDILRMRLDGEKRLKTALWDLGNPPPLEIQGQEFDTIICSNVLEHIEDHKRALEYMHSLLKTGGRLILLVPADQKIFCDLDTQLGHYRRYSKRDLSEVLQAQSFAVDEIFYHNLVGKLGWWWSGTIRKQRKLSGRQTKLFDSIVPLIRPFDKLLVKLWGGVSVIAVSRTLPKAQPASVVNA